MITIESYYNEGIRAQCFIIRVPDKDVMNIDLDIQDRLLLQNAQKDDASLLTCMRALTKVVELVERKKKNG